MFTTYLCLGCPHVTGSVASWAKASVLVSFIKVGVCTSKYLEIPVCLFFPAGSHTLCEEVRMTLMPLVVT